MKHECHNCVLLIFLSLLSSVYNRPDLTNRRVKTSLDSAQKDDLFSKVQSERVQEAISDVDADILKIEGMERKPGGF